MTEHAYLVLLSLAQQPRHGYAIVQEVAALSGGAVKLGAGTLYGLLDRLVGAGQVEHAHDEVVDGRLRRYYRLTPEGSASAAAETARLAALTRRARTVLGGPALGNA